MRRSQTLCLLVTIALSTAASAAEADGAPPDAPALDASGPGAADEPAPHPVAGGTVTRGRTGERSGWWLRVPERGWLGVKMATRERLDAALAAERLTDEWIAVPNLEWLSQKWDGKGTLVVEVVPESPAEKAGVLAGDVILSFNGIRTQAPGELAFVVQRAVVGRDGDLEVLRDGETRPLIVEVVLHPEDARRIAEEREKRDSEPAAPPPTP